MIKNESNKYLSSTESKTRLKQIENSKREKDTQVSAGSKKRKVSDALELPLESNKVSTKRNIKSCTR